MQKSKCFNCQKILDVVNNITGNFLPWSVQNNKNVSLPPNFRFLHFSNKLILSEDMKIFTSESFASRSPSGKYDLIVIDDPADIPSVFGFMEQHSQLYLLCLTQTLKDVLTIAHGCNLFWAECRSEDDGWSHLILRPRRSFDKPQWNKQKGDVLLHCDWGWGDNIQFLRYVKLVKEICDGKVILEVRLGFQNVRIDGADEVIIKGTPVPNFDYHVEVADLEKVFGFVPDFMPYISKTHVAQRSNKFCIGCVWHGHHLTFNDFRFYDPDLLKNFILPNVELCGLQKTTSCNFLRCPSFVNDLSCHIHDWTDTVNVLSKIDLLISVDTSIAHLAGAMQVPTWVLMPRKKYNTPITHNTEIWYPSVKLFFEQNGWQDTFLLLRKNLKQILLGRVL